MHISLTDTLDEYVKGKVQTGLYNNASEVIREALRLKIATEEIEQTKLQGLKQAIDPAWKQAENGEFANYSLENSLAKLNVKA